jgi:arylsulfatase A-like enzyme
VARLIDRLDAAATDSPLRGLDPAAVLAAASGKAVFEEDFESAAHPLRIRGGSCHAVRRSVGDQRGTALLCAGSRSRLYAMGARPNRHYRFSRATRHASANCRDVVLYESSLKYKRRDWNVARPASQLKIVFVHEPVAPAPGDWAAGVIDFVTTERTRSIVVEFAGGLGCTVWVDDLSLQELDDSPELRLALLKSEQPAEGADAGLGIAKHGRFLPIQHIYDGPPFDDNHDVRDSLLAPAPTTLRFRMTPRAGARLLFSYALTSDATPGQRVAFRVAVRLPDGTSHALFSDEIGPGAKRSKHHWNAGRVELDDYAGRRIELSLETTAPAGQPGYAIWGSPVIDVPRTPADPPNLILIAIDTLRADRLSSHGYRGVATPFIDALADDGVRFASAITASNWTLPSFSSIFTSLMPRRHGTLAFDAKLPAQLTTLAEYFRGAGWATAAILYKAALVDAGLDQGFDTYFNVARRLVRIDENVDKTIAWLDRNDDRRFFLFFHGDDPHQPISQPERFASPDDLRALSDRYGVKLPLSVFSTGVAPLLYEKRRFRLGGCKRCRTPAGVPEPLKQIARRLYDGEVAYSDYGVGRLLDELKRRGIYDNSIIVFVSDHGESLWERGEFYGHGRPLFYDELVHVPLIIKPPAGAGFARGKVVEMQVRTTDLLPTLLDLAGISADAALFQGEALTEYLRPDVPDGPHRIAISEMGRGRAIAVRDGRWKYLHGESEMGEREGEGASREQLFDLVADPGELNDLSAAQPAELRRLRRHALESVVAGGGRYLLVIGDGRARSYRVEIEADRSIGRADPVFGVGGDATGASTRLIFAGARDDRLVLLLRLELEHGTRTSVTLQSPDAPRMQWTVELDSSSEPLGAGALASLIESGEPGAHFLKVAPSARRSAREGMSGEQLDTLRALGYIE